MQIDLTPDEMNTILGMFNQATTPILAQNSIHICGIAQSIASKFADAAKTESTKGESNGSKSDSAAS